MKFLIQAIVFVACYCLQAYLSPFFKDLGYAVGIYIAGDPDGASLVHGLFSGILAVLLYGSGFIIAKRINERRLGGSIRNVPGTKRSIFGLLMLLADAAITGSAGVQTPCFGTGDFVVPASGGQLLYDLIFLSTFHWMGVLGFVILIWGLIVFCRRNPVVPKAAETISRQSAEKALAGFFAEVATEQAEFIKANRTAQTLNLDDPEYGLVPEKPVYCRYVDGSKDYLNSLRTENGEKLEWNRRGSMYADGINGMVDIYDSTLPSGQAYKTVYINMYADSNPITMPKGFILHFSGKKDAAPSPTQAKPKTRFCKLCGDPIDPVTRKCTGCGKQYFRPPVFTDKHYFIAATAVACGVTVFLLFALTSQRNAYETRIAQLNSNISSLETRLSEAEDEASYQSRVAETHKSRIESYQKKLAARDKTIEELQDENLNLLLEISFYDWHAVIVGDDGTKKYHKYGCPYLDTSDGLWIYNTENAKHRGYKPCSHCCD